MNAPHADAELLMLEARLTEEEALFKRLDKTSKPRSTVEKANEATERTEQQLIDTPAQGMAGVNVKLDHALSCMNPDPRNVPFNDLDWGPQILIRVYEDVARLAGMTLPADPPMSVFDLEAEMLRQRKMTGNPDLPADATAVSSERVLALVKEIAAAKAKTLPDLAAQARTLEYVLVTWGSDWDGFENFARVVREGCERLAGKADLAAPVLCPDAELLALESRLGDEENDDPEKRRAALDQLILETPANGMAGIAVKLRTVFGHFRKIDPRTVPEADLGFDENILVQVLKDAERLTSAP